MDANKLIWQPTIDRDGPWIAIAAPNVVNGNNVSPTKAFTILWRHKGSECSGTLYAYVGPIGEKNGGIEWGNDYVRKLHREIAQMQADISDARQELSAKKAEIERLKDVTNAAIALELETSSKRNDAIAERDKLTAEVAIWQERHSSVVADVENWKKRSRSDSDAWRERVDAKDVEIERAISVQRHLRETVVRLQNENEKMKEKLAKSIQPNAVTLDCDGTELKVGDWIEWIGNNKPLCNNREQVTRLDPGGFFLAGGRYWTGESWRKCEVKG